MKQFSWYFYQAIDIIGQYLHFRYTTTDECDNNAIFATIFDDGDDGDEEDDVTMTMPITTAMIMIIIFIIISLSLSSPWYHNYHHLIIIITICGVSRMIWRYLSFYMVVYDDILFTISDNQAQTGDPFPRPIRCRPLPTLSHSPDWSSKTTHWSNMARIFVLT